MKFSPKIDIFIQSIKSNHSILKDDGKIGGVFANLQYTLPNNLKTFVIF